MTPQQLWMIAGGIIGVLFLLLLLLFWQSGTWLQTRLVTEREGQPPSLRHPSPEQNRYSVD